MKKYLITGTYNAEGTAALIKEGGTKRKNAIDKMLAVLNGKVESFYYSTGEHDVYVIIELQDDITAAAISFAVNAAGLVRISTTPLFSVEDIDAACKKTVNYRAPGQK
ncbi:MAG TPA: GYD domain-containing protein [Hanamia sp.]|jgi:Uncharacterized conserved protein